MCSVSLYLTLHLPFFTAVPGDNGIISTVGIHSFPLAPTPAIRTLLLCSGSPTTLATPVSWHFLLSQPLNPRVLEIPGPLLTLRAPLVELICCQESGSQASPHSRPRLTFECPGQNTLPLPAVPSAVLPRLQRACQAQLPHQNLRQPDPSVPFPPSISQTPHLWPHVLERKTAPISLPPCSESLQVTHSQVFHLAHSNTPIFPGQSLHGNQTDL